MRAQCKYCRSTFETGSDNLPEFQPDICDECWEAGEDDHYEPASDIYDYSDAEGGL